MKTISGKLVSVQPISLSKAARYISDFASFENNGASDVLSIYLNRASEAFGSLLQLHKDLKHPQSSHKKHRKKSSHNKDATSLSNDETVNYDDVEKKSRRRIEYREDLVDKRVDGVAKEDVFVKVSDDMETTKKKRKEKIQKKGSVEVEENIGSESRKGSENGGSVEVDNIVKEENSEIGQETKSKKKKRKSVDLDSELKENSVESKKKRKSVDLDGEPKENSAEPTKKKQKGIE